MLCYLHRTTTREILSISSQMKEFNDNVQISNMFLLGKLQACPDFKTNILLFSMGVDCTQPSIFSYFYSIAERTGRIERELDASPKRETASLLRALKNTESVNSGVLLCRGERGPHYSQAILWLHNPILLLASKLHSWDEEHLSIHVACLKCCPKHCQHLHVSMLVSVIDRLACAWGKD